jgi:hypothetical protein
VKAAKKAPAVAVAPEQPADSAAEKVTSHAGLALEQAVFLMDEIASLYLRGRLNNNGEGLPELAEAYGDATMTLGGIAEYLQWIVRDASAKEGAG